MALDGGRPAPTHVIAHLSDTHLLPGGRLLGGLIDTAAHLSLCLERLEESGESIDAVVVSGDLTDDGEEASYRLLLDLLEPVIARLGATLVLTTGNHDERRPYARVVHGVDTDEPQDTVTWVRGLRIITVDSAVPGYHHGGLSDDQYAWLERELGEPAPHGTVLVMHHPPITYRSPVMQLLDFDEPGRLAGVVRGSDVRVILTGHLHATSFGTLAGIPVVVAGGVSYADDIGVPREALVAVDGPQSWNLVEVHTDDVVTTVAPARRHQSWPALPPMVMEYMATIPPEEQRETFSRKRT